ncbi:MAG: oxygenase MpaB family protein, partial [Actinomycetota bacterium]
MVVAADVGFFGPGSMNWRVNKEQVMLLGGGRALLLQLAHPMVAAGVAQHSDFASDPLKRLRRTLDATLAIVFGTIAEAERAAAQVRAVHNAVRGT